MENSKTKRLETHIEALNISYENIIAVISQELPSKEGENGDESVEMKGEKVKIYAQGQMESSVTANHLLKEIESKEDELKKLLQPKQPEGEKTKQKEEKSDKDNLSKHLK